MWEIVLDALTDSAKALPFLFLVYLVIEFLEGDQRAKDKTIKLLNGKLAPLVAGAVGLVPQCGFSVMATDLYCQNYLKLGTLVAFFVATSDEALPILITNPNTVGIVWIVLAVKIVYAVLLGYVINLFDRRALACGYRLENEVGCCRHELGCTENDSAQNPREAAVDCQQAHESEPQVETECRDSSGSSENLEHSTADAAHSCEHRHAHVHLSKWQAFWHFVKHPVEHTIKIFFYLFAINAIFGLLLFYAEDSVLNFTLRLGFFQCFFTAALGLLPNCASSVIVAEMYSEGIVGLSAMIAGLVSNSGIALAVLFRKKTHWKRNFGIVGILYAAGVVVGVAFYFVLG